MAQQGRAGPIDLPTTAAAPAAARRVIRAQAADWPEDLLDAVLLLATEVVTNAVRYGKGDITLLVADTGADGAREVRVEVTDANPELPAPPPVNGGFPGAENGRGLHLLDALTASWGATPRSDGKTVWFTVDQP